MLPILALLYILFQLIFATSSGQLHHNSFPKPLLNRRQQKEAARLPCQVEQWLEEYEDGTFGVINRVELFLRWNEGWEDCQYPLLVERKFKEVAKLYGITFQIPSSMTDGLQRTCGYAIETPDDILWIFAALCELAPNAKQPVECPHYKPGEFLDTRPGRGNEWIPEANLPPLVKSRPQITEIR